MMKVSKHSTTNSSTIRLDIIMVLNYTLEPQYIAAVRYMFKPFKSMNATQYRKANQCILYKTRKQTCIDDIPKSIKMPSTDSVPKCFSPVSLSTDLMYLKFLNTVNTFKLDALSSKTELMRD